MRLIDAKFTVYAAESEFDEEDASKIRWLISHIPTVDAEIVRHGEWIVESRSKFPFDGVSIKCSLCGRYEYKKEPYCHCGAKMKGENV